MLETKTRQLQNPSSSSTSSSSSSSSAAAALIAFKPRQVLLLASKSPPPPPPPPPMAKKKQQQQQADDGATIKTVLQQSIIHYFHLNGFSKTLKRFLKETKTEGDSWKSCSLNLEDMCYKYLNNSTDNDTNSKGNGEPGNLGQCEDGTNGKNTTKNAADSQETISKKKKKKRSEDKNNVPDASGPESVDKSMKNAMNSQEVLADNKAEVSLKKQKEKKKKKTEEKPEGAVVGDNDVVGEPTKKDKKKKSKEENGATGTKDSKKRKRLASDENANQGVEGVGTEESKRRKTEGLKESMDVARQGKSDDLCTENGHTGNGEASLGEPRKSDVNHEEEFNSSAKQNSSRKERNGSAEPKTVNAFQRVKIDQVEFKDDRLKDNSYWAKDGAEIGYGAKAQEVLGQVKGRDFRHEKTKKKRGSYRGGLIDLQSHSVKFNYSDEE